MEENKKNKRIRSILGYLQEDGPPEALTDPETPGNEDADYTQAGEPAEIAGINLKKKKKMPGQY